MRTRHESFVFPWRIHRGELEEGLFSVEEIFLTKWALKFVLILLIGVIHMIKTSILPGRYMFEVSLYWLIL